VLPNQRALDDQGRAGLEEERRLAHVGLTRARRRAKIYFTSNRRIHGSWSSSIPSRFLDELPEAHVEVTEAKGGFGNFGQNYGASRFDTMESFGSNYTTPGWQRAQARKARSSSGFEEDQSDYASDEAIADDAPPAARTRKQTPKRRLPLTIEGELVAKSTGTMSPFGLGDRVFHQKFGNGNVTHVDGNKLTIAFDKAGEKRVVDSFVERV